ncbi:MAG: hypothetical protein QGH13_01450 [Candidatus Thalassarchaeaceae archaeon]|nr:hypothetical protein [Candidatus Thalassarchaeaceae archaeon]
MEHFEGDLDTLWRLDFLPPLHRFTWQWWWWLVVLPCDKHPERSKQLMVLWSTKDTASIDVSGVPWEGQRFHTDEDGGHTLGGMVAAWWYDGEKMFEPLVLRKCRMLALDHRHNLWPSDIGGGAIVPLTEDDLSMGLRPDNSAFWLRLKSDQNMVEKGAPNSFNLEMTPWNPPLSAATRSHNLFAGSMGYDILRLHGTRASGTIDGEAVEGSAYFQKVVVQAPSVPWFWGFLHFDDGSYFDWFMPHLSLSVSANDSRPWKRRDRHRFPLRTAGLFHDARRGRTERFEQCEVELIHPSDGGPLDSDGHPLPSFKVRVWNGRTQLSTILRATSRAHWTFDQPTRMGLKSHFTYNEYPLTVEKLVIIDEIEVRTPSDYEWIRGNAEHSWGILH